MSVTFHYPPDLFELLVQTIPLVCRSKQNVLTFFKGAGVDARLMSGVTRKVNEDKDSITKYEIVRTVLEKLNEKGDVTLATRREVLRRIVEFEDFSTCWPDDRLKAQGLIAQIRQVVNVKDSFTRMREEREREQRERRAEQEAKLRQDQQRREAAAAVKADLFALFGEQNPHRRGKKSASSYTEPAVQTCRESLHRVVVILCNLQEIVMLLDKEADLKTLLKEKIRAAIVHKNPFYEPLSDNL